MNYKLICIDMDGTLLDNSAKNIPNENLEAIKSATEKGVKVAITTGRLFTSARYFSDLIGVKTPVIASNGAYIREKDSDKVIAEFLLGEENIKAILDVVKEYDIRVFFNTVDTVITDKDILQGNAYMEMNKDLPKEMQVKFLINEDLKSTSLRYKDEILKCICINENNVYNTKEIEELKMKLKEIDSIEVVSSNHNNFEIMNKGVSKGKAVETLAKEYGIPKDEVIAIGDGENDLSMIKYAGLGVAMGNSSDFIKEQADYVTDTNVNAGVGKVIKKFVLNK
ncbi:Cof-type HAD-IIB family hydrolase [Clostridium bornimense]|uniref:Cof-type HAD-IIB family hydrolase n=1 Tax=Clostridium bornimense TaxID=1216932 RepID=UPI001C120CE8|nr:Cof-type HAD-IIB family hydrolase [Clostridium bornimense]MBU5315980.1 Cof-type HAD-IIB family hydrolase [Clostridium bornimense]